MKTIVLNSANPYQNLQSYRQYEMVLYNGILKIVNKDIAVGAGVTLLDLDDVVSWNNVTLTGNVNIPTPTIGDNSTLAASTAFVTTAVSNAISAIPSSVSIRGSYNASGNAFPTSGGSGSAGAIKKGDLWTINVAGTLGGTAIKIGDTILALSDSPGQTTGNWLQLSGNLGYTAENVSNKDTDTTLSSNSDTKYPSQKAVKTYSDTPLSSVWKVADGTDNSKRISFDVSNISPSTTRVVTFPNTNVNLGKIPSSFTSSGQTLTITTVDGSTLSASVSASTTWITGSNQTVSVISGKEYMFGSPSGSLTITLPASPSDGDVITIRDNALISAWANITSLTVNSGATNSVLVSGTHSVNLKTSYSGYMVNGASIRLIFSATDTTWYVDFYHSSLIPFAASFRNGSAVGTITFAGTQTGNRTVTWPDSNIDLRGFPYINSLNSNSVSGTNSVIVGGSSNTVSGTSAFVGAGSSNSAAGNYAVTAGGLSNSASGLNVFIGGGYSNSTNSAQYATIGGGYLNRINNSSPANGSDYSSILGGISNQVNAGKSVICGGDSNSITSGLSDVRSGILTGVSNSVTGRQCAILCGGSNVNNGFAAVVAAGTGNTIAATGYYGSILAGRNNTMDGESVVLLTGYGSSIFKANYSVIHASNKTATRSGGARVTQLLQGVTISTTPIYLDAACSNSTSAVATADTPLIGSSNNTGEYTIARHIIKIMVCTYGIGGDSAFGTIETRWKSDNNPTSVTYTRIGSDVVTTEYEDASLAGVIAAIVISNTSGHLQVKVTAPSSAGTVWKAFVTSDYSTS